MRRTPGIPFKPLGLDQDEGHCGRRRSRIRGHGTSLPPPLEVAEPKFLSPELQLPLFSWGLFLVLLIINE